MESELAHLARRRGDLPQAKEAYRRLIRVWRELGQQAAVAHQLECFASIAQQEGDPQRAARLLGAAEALRERVHTPRRGIEIQEYTELAGAVSGQMDAEDYTVAWKAGRALDMDAAVEYAVTPAPEATLSGER